nr:hypothetical protein [Ruminococcus sp.]
LDSNYSEKPSTDPTRATEPTETTNATEPTETTNAVQPAEATEPTKAPAPVTSLSVKAVKNTIYAGKTTKVTAAVKNAVGNTVFKSDNSSVEVVKVKGNTAEIKGKSGGSAKITATNNGVSASVRITVKKNKNTIKVKGLTVRAKAKAKTVIKKTKAFSIRSAQGEVTFKKLSGDKKITVSKSGSIVVKKGLKKGETYKLKVSVTAKGNKIYSSLEEKATINILIV